MTGTVRYQAAIIRDDHLLLIKVNDHIRDETFWAIPGGGREPGETEEECVRREVQEETHLNVAVGELVMDEEAHEEDQIYQRARTFRCRIESGKARPGYEPEAEFDATIEEIGWFNLNDPSEWDPLAIRDAFTFPLLQKLRSALGYS